MPEYPYKQAKSSSMTTQKDIRRSLSALSVTCDHSDQRDLVSAGRWSESDIVVSRVVQPVERATTPQGKHLQKR